MPRWRHATTAMPPEYAELSHAIPWLFPSFAFVFGAIMGSFLNVVIYRVPAGKSVVHPRSHCTCGKPIAWYDNLPILSWFILRGRARCCGRPYSFRYPFVEFLTASLFLACWLRFSDDSPAKALCGMMFVSVLICATFIDLDHMIIPDVFTIWFGVVGVIASFAVPLLHGQSHELMIIARFHSTTDALQGLFVGSGLVLWIALLAEAVLRKEAMGFGDVKFVGMIGAFCGWQGAVCSVFGGACVGTVWFVLALFWQKVFPKKDAAQPASGSSPSKSTDAAAPGEASEEASPLALGMQVPFGPMLAAGALIYFLAADRWIAAYLQQFQGL